MRTTLMLVALLIPASALAAEWVQVAIKDSTGNVIYSESLNAAHSASYPASRSFSGHTLDITREVAGGDVTYCYTFTPAGASAETHCFMMATGNQCASASQDWVIASAGSDDTGNAPSLSGTGGVLESGAPGDTSSAGAEDVLVKACATYSGTKKCSETSCPTSDATCDTANCEPPCIECN